MNPFYIGSCFLILVKELETSWSCSRCQTPRFNDMIACDGCGEWYHWYIISYVTRVNTYFILLPLYNPWLGKFPMQNIILTCITHPL